MKRFVGRARSNRVNVNMVIAAVAALLGSNCVQGQSPADSLHPTAPARTVSAASQLPAKAEERSWAVVCRDARQTLGAQAAASRRGAWPDWEQATRRLVTLNDELRLHARQRQNAQTTFLKRTIAARLERARQQLIGGAEALRSAQSMLELVGPSSASATLVALPATTQEFAQQLQLPVQQGAAFGGGFNGPAPPGGAGPAEDYSDDLIALIEATINADIWESAGGPASLVYYRPALALVISAPADVHDGVVDLLYQLRRANGP